MDFRPDFEGETRLMVSASFELASPVQQVSTSGAKEAVVMDETYSPPYSPLKPWRWAASELAWYFVFVRRNIKNLTRLLDVPSVANGDYSSCNSKNDVLWADGESSFRMPWGAAHLTNALQPELLRVRKVLYATLLVGSFILCAWYLRRPQAVARQMVGQKSTL